MLKIGLLVLSVILGAIGQIAFKYGVMALGTANAAGIFRYINLPLFLGSCSYGISTVIYLYVLRIAELSYAYPMISMGYALVVVASHFIFNEPISAMRILGVIIILTGIVVVSQS